MTVEHNRARQERFLAVVLPWLVAAGGFLVYLGTLNHWVSLRSLATVARASGWTWQPQLQQPLLFLVLYPAQLLPESWIPLALNLFAAGCAALVLLLLARSVALLPQDRTREQRWREEGRRSTFSMPTVWMPPVLAALACGLQLTFWEDATSATGNMISLLVFAGVIWSLLEFRIRQNQSWLFASAVLCGAGLANDWSMIAYFPVFLATIVWLKGLSFFNLRFLLRMALCGLAGLSLYLLLPAVCVFHPTLHVGFWEALKTNLKSQRDALGYFPREALAALAMTCLLPLLVISIRWKSQGPHSGDDNPVTGFITKGMFHFVHAGFLVVSLWIALDPAVSPRNLGLGAPLLTQYYLSALVIGYCSGYLLLVGSVPVLKLTRFEKSPRTRKFVAKLTVSAFWLLLVTMPLALVWRNLGQIRTTNGPALHEFARQLYQGLPAGKSVALSDDPTTLLLALAELGARGHDKNALVLDMNALAWGQYQIIKAGHFKARWPGAPPTNGLAVLEPAKVLNLLSRFSSREPMICLNPSFSYGLEPFATQPSGAVQHLVARLSDAPDQTLDSRIAAASEQYWQERWGNTLRALADQTSREADAAPRAAGQLAARLHLTAEPNHTVSFLGAAYSRSLNHWGVQMQRLGRWKEAGVWFQRALELKPENLATRINLEFNQRHQRGEKERLDLELVEKEFLHLFARHRNWEAVINDNGPVDEPTFLFETGRVLLAGGRPHQAIRELARCADLAPDWLEPRLWLAQGHVAAQEFASALHVTDAIEASSPPRDGTGIAQLLFCRSTALQGLGRTNEAGNCINAFVTQHPEQAEVLSIAAQLYLQSLQFQPALAVLDRLLNREPQNPELLSNKGLAEMQLTRYDAAITTLTTALSLAPSNQVVRLNRAIACLRAGQLDAARADYQQLLTTSPNSYKVLFGLGEIAWRRQETNAAIQFYQQCLPLGIPASAENKLVADRLKRLKVGTPTL
jgi:tetratricopeptide (TPR) repeat protein